MYLNLNCVLIKIEIFFVCQTELFEMELFEIETELTLNGVVEIELFWHLIISKQKLYLF